jgi:hypothetical protein
MKKFYLLVLILASHVFLVSCGREKLTPLVNPVTVNELRNDQAINFSYKIDQTQIDEYARGTKKFPIFGRLFQAIAFVLANSTINSKGGMDLEMDPMELDLNSLGEIDFDMIDWISFDSLLLQVDNAKKKDSLEFIERIEILAKLDTPIEGLAVDKNGFSRLVFYDKKIHKLDCSGSCLSLRIERTNWRELIKSNPRLALQPKIIINSVPKSSMALAGSVSFSIKFNLGF